MPMRYRRNILALLKDSGYSTYKIRTEKLLAESTVQKLRADKPVSWENIEAVCGLLGCQPGDILEFTPDK